MRAIIVDVTGPAPEGGGRAPVLRVVFDRYGLNKQVFKGRSDEEALNHAPSNALTAVMEKHGVDWPQSHTIRTLP